MTNGKCISSILQLKVHSAGLIGKICPLNKFAKIRVFYLETKLALHAQNNYGPRLQVLRLRDVSNIAYFAARMILHVTVKQLARSQDLHTVQALHHQTFSVS